MTHMQMQMQMQMPSREELFGKVQDLCTHGYGPKLYTELIGILDQAAFTCASRLLNENSSSSSSSSNTDDAHRSASTASSNDNMSYPTMNCASDSARVYFTSVHEERPASEGSFILENVWAMYSDYVQFLNCVRNVFLSLDRMFLYLPPVLGQMEGRVLPRNSSGSIGKSASASGGGIANSGDESMGSGGGGRYVDLSASVGAAWDMWDVGMHCLYKHLAMKHDTATAAAAAAASNSNDMECSDGSNGGKYSVMQALKVRTIQCILAELDLLHSAAAANNQATDVDMSGNTEMLHKSLVRNCVSIFRALAHVSDHDDNNVNKGLLHDLVHEMTLYFQKESMRWMSPSDSNSSSAPSKTSYDCCSLLHHIDNRIKQVNGMTAYYHLASDAGDIAMPASHRKRQNRILTHLVEEFLLTPHFTPQLILHPSNLYPILDQEQDSQNQDAKLLFNLSKCIVHLPSHASAPAHHNTITSFPGMESLKQCFEAYGKERGTAIMRPASIPLAPPMGSAVKPPPPMTVRDTNTKIIINLLQYKAHLEYLHVEAFGGDEFFGRTLRKVLEDVLNAGGAEDANESKRKRYGNESDDGGKRIAELLAKYMDLRFKNAKSGLAASTSSPMKSGRSATSISVLSASTNNADNDTEALQVKVLDLFRSVQSKDVFEAFYRQDLAKRLLLNKSSSIDAERSFVSKLKAECGTGYTSKMDGMFKDMDLSKDVMSNYTAHLAGLESSSTSSTSASASAKVEMDVQVLTTGYWPFHTQHPDLILPSTLESRKVEFDTYYKSKYQGRRITWQNGLGNCIVKAQFPKITGTRELNVSLCQALVLLCFNLDDSTQEDTPLTITEVMKTTGISDRGEAERVLQSLSMGREGTQVLRRLENNNDSSTSDKANTDTTPRKKPKTVRKAIADSDTFTFNPDFTSNQRRIRITNIQMKETVTERKKTHESVILDRLHLIDAAIVRIMKARKTLDHRDLVGEVMNQLKFPTSGVDIKKRIESLIEREYLERVEGDVSRYNYLA